MWTGVTYLTCLPTQSSPQGTPETSRAGTKRMFFAMLRENDSLEYVGAGLMCLFYRDGFLTLRGMFHRGMWTSAVGFDSEWHRDWGPVHVRGCHANWVGMEWDSCLFSPNTLLAQRVSILIHWGHLAFYKESHLGCESRCSEKSSHYDEATGPADLGFCKHWGFRLCAF